MSLIRTSFGYSRTVLLALMFILITGSVAYNDIPKESEPDIDIPIIYVTIRHDGISPEDAERLLIRPIEQELKTIEGIRKCAPPVTRVVRMCCLSLMRGLIRTRRCGMFGRAWILRRGAYLRRPMTRRFMK